MSSRGGLVGRVRHILDGHRPVPHAGRAWTALAAFARAGVVAITALAQSRPAREDVREKPMANLLEKDKTPSPRRSLRGTVLGPDGRPVAGASVRWLVQRNPKLSFVAMPKGEVGDPIPDDREVTLGDGRTDAQGHFAFEAEYDHDAYYPVSMLAVWAPGFGVLGKTVRGEDRDLEARLTREIPIRGRLLTPSGMPAAGVKVTLLHIQDVRHDGLGVGRDRKEEDYPDYWPRPRTTDADGRFTIAGVPAGIFASIELTHPDYAVDEVTVTYRAEDPRRESRGSRLSRCPPTSSTCSSLRGRSRAPSRRPIRASLWPICWSR